MQFPDFQQLFGWGFVAAGTYNAVWCAGKLIRAQQTQRWPSIPGKVISRGITSRCHDDDVQYSPCIRYRYQIGERQYDNTIGVHTLVQEWGDKDWAEEIARRFESDTVQVYYDPKDHSKSVLERGIDRSYIWMIPCCLVLVGIGLWMTEIWKTVV